MLAARDDVAEIESDLPVRLAKGKALAAFDPGTLYTPGEKGYSDYPAAA